MQRLEVTKAFDGSISPPGLKMIVCINYHEGYFFRINTKSIWKPCVLISASSHDFLSHDSHIECTPLQFDEFLLEESVKRYGVIGKIDELLSVDLLTKVRSNFQISPSLRDHIARFLEYRA
jgi:hypothetical protein